MLLGKSDRNFIPLSVIYVTKFLLALAKLQFLENGPNYVRVCCGYVSVEAYEITWDERKLDIIMFQTLNQTPIANVTMETFAFSNIHLGNVIPLIPRYNFILYHWYLFCLNNQLEKTCIFARPCDCSCDKTAWLKYNVTIILDTLQYNLTVTSQFYTEIFPLPVIPTYSWFASDYTAIEMCKSGEISPDRCDFMFTGAIVVETKGSTNIYSKTSSIQLDTEHLYFSISLITEPRWVVDELTFDPQMTTPGWIDNPPIGDESTFDPRVVEIFRNQSGTVYNYQYAVWQANENRLSGRAPSTSEEMNRLCTAVGSLIQGDQLKGVGNDKLKEMTNNNNNNSSLNLTPTFRLYLMLMLLLILVSISC